jgi:hypothetical protein
VTDKPDWQAINDQYLRSALTWLRLRLEQIAGSVESAQQTVPAQYPGKKSLLNILKQKPAPENSGMVLLDSSHKVADEMISISLNEMINAEGMSPPPALILLSQLLGLSRFEKEILLLCAGMELDTRIPSLCAQAQDNPHRPYPTFALAMALFDDPLWDALSPYRPLRHWRLIEINQSSSQPLTTSALRADERIVNFIKGLNSLDERLASLLISSDTIDNSTELPPSQKQLAENIRECLIQSHDAKRTPVIELLGSDSSSKLLVAQHIAATLGRHLYQLPAEIIPSQPDELEVMSRLWERESILLPISLYINARDAHGQVLPISRFLAHSSGICFLDVRDICPLLSPVKAFDITKPTPAEQESLWNATTGYIKQEYARVLAEQFNMNIPNIHSIARSVLATANEEAYYKQLWNACLEITHPRLDLLAQRLIPKVTWEDFVLPERELNLLHEIAAQVKNRLTVYDDWGFRHNMNRGLGISVLFAGESGTGKTMAAEVIANELNLNLYRIDLSQVVSKYIGETEKNLRRLFDAAEDGGAILFFDEADALFGKRSEVRDSHDRYANIEINYLLQRMETFQGLAILATNTKGSLDPAFVRRLRFIVDFPYPGLVERKTIWQKAFPAQTPIDNLDFERLARFNLTGGSIHNIALNAAFLAANALQPVNMRFVLDAAKTEFRKTEKSVIDAEFKL